MPTIRPCADLRNNYNEISRFCHETKQPVFITKNGYNDLVVLSNDAYESMNKLNESKIEKIISDKFSTHFKTYEEFKKDIIEKIEIALKEVDDGKCEPFKNFCKEMEEKYDIH